VQSTDKIFITGAADFIGSALVQEITLAGEINTVMPDHVVKVAFEALNNDSKAVDDLIVVQTPDALLVADRHQADAIKKLTALLPPGLR